MEHKYAGRLVISFIVLLFGILGIVWPPTRLFNPDQKWHNLKPGIDINGGTSLVYEINAPPSGVTPDLSQRVADSLKRRVDPNGVMNLVWRPQGPTRLEIQMPLQEGSERVKEARNAFSEAQAALEKTNIRLPELRALAQVKDPAQRQREIERLAGGSPRRLDLLKQYLDANQRLAAAEQANDPIKKVDARDEIRQIEADLQATNLPTQQIQAELELIQSSIEKAQRARKKEVVEAKLKERAAKLAAIRSQFSDFPSRLKAIDDFVAAFDNFSRYRGTVGDAEDLKRLLRGSGVLEFHILVTDPAVIAQAAEKLRTDGPAYRPGDPHRWYEVERPDQMKGHHLESYGDKTWVLASVLPDESMVHKEGAAPWGLERAYKDFDTRSSEAVVAFVFDGRGSVLFGELTGNNLRKPLAIVLDDKVISAPTIQSKIERQGQISGNYTEQELTYLIKTLNAGSLPARLNNEPISERTVGPTLGRDNLRAGFIASIFGVISVAVFMISYYYFAGSVATVAVIMNLVLNIGIMAMFNATFTLPGIAALALTVGMAVDANVLIYERLREEQLRGLSLRMAIRNAYDRAFSAIFDSNLTTIATSVILYWFGSEEIKGFGLTLTIGIAASMFSALYVTRAVFDFCTERLQMKTMGSLPLTFPKWDQALRPNIDWMGKAWIFYSFSTVIIVVGLACFALRWNEMFDIEFVSGTSVQVELTEPTGIQKVRDLIQQPQFKDALPSPQVVTVNNTGVDYEIVTPNDNTQAVRSAVVKAIGPLLKVELPSKFDLAGAPFDEAMSKVVLPIGVEPITVDGFTATSAASAKGGVAIVLNNLEPAISPNQIRDRMERVRLEPGSNLPYREVRVDAPVENPGQPTAKAVVIVADDIIDYDRDPAAWQTDLAAPLWKLVNESVNRPADLRRVTSFDPQVAGDMKMDAAVAVALSILAIAVYVWVRFGNLKYGTATVAALLHDVLVVIGLLGMSHYVAEWAIGQKLMIDPFRMNLTMIAALLTVMGYSVNDTIVVFDRIRENRGKFGHISRTIINDSISQTFSRTILTGGTTIFTLFVMYVYGGPGIHGFTFALLAGILVGTYSSFAIAAPLLLLGKGDLAVEPVANAPVGQLQRANP